MNHRLRSWGQVWLIPFIVITAWEIATRLGLLDQRFFIPASDMLATVYEQLAEGRLGSDLVITLRRLGIAFAFAAVAGVAVGVASGVWRSVELLVRPVSDTLYPLPKIAVLPLFIIVVGRGEVAFILTAFATAFFQIIISTRGAVKNVDSELVEAGRNFGATGPRYFTKLLFPAIAPGLFNGLRLGLATCLITLVATEFVGADRGLGAMIYRAGQQFAVDQMYAGLFLVGAIGLVANLLFLALEPILLPWQKGGLKESTEMVSQGA